ncbi:hypothetical protein SLEP1_g6619 [Rubroshorea leprosula]|uniref:Uncharacterized protein n=1 Tax=Rubroshorea leprosula TaxID=152421 RepID=A0AAV5I1N3_9ROSI|nr:hypothetical protein SLEP1_g6619 [Rubroshorea leprosula]
MAVRWIIGVAVGCCGVVVAADYRVRQSCRGRGDRRGGDDLRWAMETEEKEA